MFRASESAANTGRPGLGAAIGAPYQERATTQVTISGAEAGTLEAIDASVPSAPAVSGFDGLGLSPEILKAVADSGYTTPTPIQAQGIPLVLQRRDLIGIAQTGTGKTASFTLPMIEMLSRGRSKARMPRALVLEPTRELADQVSESFDKYSKYSKLSHALLIGGVSMDDQTRKLDRGVDVLIATPGRLLDHFERGRLMLSQVNILVIDEADRMLDMGFIPDVERICKLLPFTRQTLFYSATMPPEIQRLTDQFLHNPAKVEVARPATTASTITQELVEVPANDWAKREALRRLIRECDAGLKNAIVFCNRKRDVDVVAKSLAKHGFDAAPIHGDLDQSLRMKTLEKFRAGELKILVASDVAARGLDVPSVSHVFNFDVPIHADDYVHRIGRTGRAGRSGHAYMLATPRDAKYVETIEKLTTNKLARRQMTDIEVREEPRRHGGDRHGGRDKKGGRDRKHRDRRPPGAKFHDHVAAMEPAAAPVVTSAPHPAITDAPAPESRPAHAGHGHRDKPRHEQKQRHERPRSDAPAQAQTVDKSQLPAFLFRPVPVRKPE
jgi:superfamily II DNA/RNA helicase